MHKYVSLLIISTAILLFSGCNGNSQEGGFVFSPSLWKSTDGGKTWEVKNAGVGAANIKNVDVLSIAVNPSDGQNIYAGLREGGILMTENGGESWKFMNFQSEKVYGLAVGPANGRTLYASGVWQGTGKIFKTEDVGENWKEIYTSPGKGPIVISITLDKNRPNTIFVTTSENEALKSEDQGQSWKNIFIANSPIIGMAIDAQNSDLVYVITDSSQILRSRDGGANFEDISAKIKNISSGFSGRQFKLLKADPKSPNEAYLAGEGGIAVSRDAGETWKSIPALNDSQKFPITALLVSPTDSIVYGSAQASYVSADKAGQTDWVTFQFNTPKKINVINYDLQNPQIIYAGFADFK
jgi:photosystem II stability/assembly factor-like uncharacterized protein